MKPWQAALALLTHGDSPAGIFRAHLSVKIELHLET